MLGIRTVFLLTSLMFAIPAAGQNPSRRPNVLFIAVDDLRPQLGCYGGMIKTPNIDALAAGGILFSRAYCQQAVCNPSRVSLLSGRRPDTTKVYDLETHLRLNLPDVVTLPQHFKNNGYHTQSLGKIYHPGLDDPLSWSAPTWNPRGQEYTNPATREAIQKERARIRAAGGRLRSEQVLERDPKTGAALKVARPGRAVRGTSWEAADSADNGLGDGKIADRAVDLLAEYKAETSPFFLAVGFHKPHLPFIAPKKYFDLYPPESIKLPDNYHAPKDCPPAALHNSGELRQYSDIPREGPVPTDKARELIRAYYAAASYMDAQVGRVLDALEKNGQRENTIVVLWGDHGWHLGEHGLWCKHSNFEVATRSPLIVSAPGQKTRGAKTDRLVEFVDVYPTLTQLAGLPVPDGIEGTSLVPLMENPNRAWKSAAFSQYPRASGVMGRSIRTERYRFTEWASAAGESVGVELYDHHADSVENENVAARPENKDLVERLRAQLKAGWRASAPAPLQ